MHLAGLELKKLTYARLDNLIRHRGDYVEGPLLAVRLNTLVLKVLYQKSGTRIWYFRYNIEKVGIVVIVRQNVKVEEMKPASTTITERNTSAFLSVLCTTLNHQGSYPGTGQGS